jgi:hypothetical protein
MSKPIAGASEATMDGRGVTSAQWSGVKSILSPEADDEGEGGYEDEEEEGLGQEELVALR